QIKFNRRYQYIWLKNLGEDYVYVSDKPGIVASADNVAKLSAGEILMLTSINDDIYTLGATTLECHAQEYASCPFGEVGGSGGGSEAVLEPKSVTQNGDYYAVDDEFDGYSSVSVNVEANVDSKSITQNGTYSAATDNLDGYSSVSVNVPNSYSVSDEGKVVSSGALVSQTSTTKTQNGTYDTTLNDEVVIEVPNSYSVSDEGKVVSSGALVSQTSVTKTQNGTYDTTLNNEVVVNVTQSMEDVLRMSDKLAVAIDGNDYYFKILAVGWYRSYAYPPIPEIQYRENLFYVATPPAGYNYGTGAFMFEVYDASTDAFVTSHYFGNFAGQGFDAGEYVKAISFDVDFTNKTFTIVFEDTDTRVPRQQTLVENVTQYLTVTGDDHTYSYVSPILSTKSITQNGTYTAATENADGYSSVSVDVPNTYAVSDEGKVVSSGALVAQTSITKTQNGTYDTTLNDEVVVNVPPDTYSGVIQFITDPTYGTKYPGTRYAIGTGSVSDFVELLDELGLDEYFQYQTSQYGVIFDTKYEGEPTDNNYINLVISPAEISPVGGVGRLKGWNSYIVGGGRMAYFGTLDDNSVCRTSPDEDNSPLYMDIIDGVGGAKVVRFTFSDIRKSLAYIFADAKDNSGARFTFCGAPWYNENYYGCVETFATTDGEARGGEAQETDAFRYGTNNWFIARDFDFTTDPVGITPLVQFGHSYPLYTIDFGKATLPNNTHFAVDGHTFMHIGCGYVVMLT
ncbi:MAG: hypothetical protein J6U54_14240, partial [Clostridiales bacterium]|nr:hypothetical protein [Clostridiales bacterium]